MATSEDQERLAQFDADRSWENKAFRSACYAPFSSMYFDQRGFVRVCCQNYQHSIGNLTHQSIDEIWNGRRAEMLRGALRRYDFSLGCQYCEWQLREGNFNNFARTYDVWPVESEENLWPAQMEFSISNVCNLECVMCNGEWSSSIRARREKLPPLPKVYGDSFFSDLRKYLPHLRRLRFLGGEPFLVPEHYRIWDMFIEEGISIDCHVTTNGTQYNSRVERILNAFPVSLSVSMDGFTPETVEMVRKNAVHGAVIENFKRFHEYASQRGTSVNLTYCLMPLNWHDFGDFLLFADSWDCDVTVNTVLHPPEHSFYTKTSEELKPFIQGLVDQGDRVLSQLGRNRKVWVNEFERLKHRMEHAQTVLIDFVPGELVQLQLPANQNTQEPDHQMLPTLARTELSQWGDDSPVDEVVFDENDRVVDVVSSTFLGLERSNCLGRTVDEIYALLRMRYGAITAVNRKEHGNFVDRLFGFQDTDLTDRTFRLISFPRPENPGSVMMGTIINEAYPIAQHRKQFST